MSRANGRVPVPADDLASFLRGDALELSDRAGLDIAVELVPRDGGPADAQVVELCRRLRAGRGNLDLLQRMAALGELGAALLHEVRNVLTGVRGFGQVALGRPGGGDGRQHLEVIARETERAIDLLSRYLDLSRSDGRRPARLGSRALIESTVLLVRHRFRMAGVLLACNHGPDSSLLGREEELQQVLVNLLINALQVSAPGAEVRIAAALAGEADDQPWLAISVADDGPGIAPEHRARLFEPFFTTKPAGEGIGLGLAVSQGIVNRHGGAIEVAGAIGAGATFTVRLPLARGSSEGADPAEGADANGAEKAGAADGAEKAAAADGAEKAAAADGAEKAGAEIDAAAVAADTHPAVARRKVGA